MMISLGQLKLEDIPAGSTSTKVHSCWEGSDESDESQAEDFEPEDMRQAYTLHEGERSCPKRCRKLSRAWSAGKWVENESAMRGMVLSMHHGYVQVRFGDEIKNCRRHQLTLLPDRIGRQRRTQGRLGEVVDELALDQSDDEGSSGSADSGASPASPMSPALADSTGAHGSLEGVKDGCARC